MRYKVNFTDRRPENVRSTNQCSAGSGNERLFPTWVTWLCRNGTLEARRWNKLWMIDADSLEHYLRKHNREKERNG
jgi:hypothetical protein